jgi:preprotein translocase subunit SecA
MFSKVVGNAQKRIEGNNFDSRKNVLKYDEVLRKQRETLYKLRRDVIELDDVNDIVNTMIRSCAEEVCDVHIEEVSRGKYKIDDEAIVAAFNGPIYPENTLDINVMKTMDEKEIVDYVYECCMKLFDEKKSYLPDPKIWDGFMKHITLRVLTSFWTKHIDSMSELRQSVRLQSYAQQNPLIMYQQVGYERFEEMMDNIGRDVTKYLAHVRVQIEPREEKPTQYQTNQADDQSLKRRPTKNEPNKKLGPNDPCYCGSGKKFKYCCGARR